MKKISAQIKTMILSCMLLLVCTVITADVTEVNAAAAKGFVTRSGKTYYIKENGSKQKGWLNLNGTKYYFDEKTGVQLKGWQKDADGRLLRYFTQGSGAMVTGWLKNSSGSMRYFEKKAGSDQGLMYTGLKKVGSYYFYFSKSTGIRYQKGFGTGSYSRYYFNPKNGRAQTGWLTLNKKKYYFDSKGVMYVNTVKEIEGKTYKFDSKGVASETKYTVQSDGKVKVTDANGKTFLLAKEYLTHPGVADGKKSDLDLLAALCETEAGDQGLIGMEAVALCVLNRTIDPNKEFPSSVRYNLYLQGNLSYPQYTMINNGTYIKRLKGQYDNRTAAYKAASEAMKIHENYVRNKTKRTLKGFQTKDFNYKYFMMTYSFYQMNLNFNKVVNEKYKDHMFFVDWV